MSRRFSLAALSILLPMAVLAVDVKIQGSDLLRGALAKPLAGRTLPDGRTLRLEFAGTRDSLEALRTRKADLALVVFTPDEALPEKDYQLLPLAYQVVVFATHANNPVRAVTLAQLGGVFGDREAARYRQWGELGAKGVWALKSISLNKVDAPESVGLDLFSHTALTTPQLKTTILDLPTPEELLRKVRVDDTCIGLFLGPIADASGVNVLLVAKSDKDVPFGPTPENIHVGDYPLRLPFYVAFDRSRAVELRPALALLLGEAVAAGLEKDGLVPVPANARLEIRRSLGIE